MRLRECARDSWFALAIATVGMIFGLTGLVGAASAAVPGQVAYQGLLLDSGGAPVTGVVSLTARLFDAETGGTSVWTESHPAVDVLDGVYSVDLGSITPLSSAILVSGLVYLEIQIDSETLAPRQRLLAVPYALEAEHAANVGGFSSQYFTQMLQHVDFDGNAPGNLDPREGLGDADNDGQANFLDADNDNDGLLDGIEIAEGSDINQPTPTIDSFSPFSANGFEQTPISIFGTNFVPGSTVSFGVQTPAIVNLTPTQIDVVVEGQPKGQAAVTVTRPNGEVGTSTFPFFLLQPTISSFSPPTADGFTGTTTVTINGTNFTPDSVVAFGSLTPAITHFSPTAIDVEVGNQPEGDAIVTVTHPNGEVGASTFPFFFVEPSIVFFQPAVLAPGETGTVTIVGTDFVSGMTVQFGSQTPIPTNITPTSFDVTVGPFPVEGTETVSVTRPNGKSDSQAFPIGTLTPGLIFIADINLIGGDGLAGADADCTTAANNAGISGNFIAWLSDGTESPFSRVDRAVAPYRNISGTIVANNFDDLTDGNLGGTVRERADGTLYTGLVHTGTLANGQHNPASSCTWASPYSGTSTGGSSLFTDSRWTDRDDNLACGSQAIVYCLTE